MVDHCCGPWIEPAPRSSVWHLPLPGSNPQRLTEHGFLTAKNRDTPLSWPQHLPSLPPGLSACAEESR
jgi:hypothetical protein